MYVNTVITENKQLRKKFAPYLCCLLPSLSIPQPERHIAAKTLQPGRLSQKEEEDKHGEEQWMGYGQPDTCVSRQLPTKFNCEDSQK